MMIREFRVPDLDTPFTAPHSVFSMAEAGLPAPPGLVLYFEAPCYMDSTYMVVLTGSEYPEEFYPILTLTGGAAWVRHHLLKSKTAPSPQLLGCDNGLHVLAPYCGIYTDSELGTFAEGVQQCRKCGLIVPPRRG